MDIVSVRTRAAHLRAVQLLCVAAGVALFFVSAWLFLQSTSGRTLIIVDANVPDASLFEEHAVAGARVVRLDAGRDGLAQITEALEGESRIAHLQIVSHGAPGQLFLGNGTVNTDTLSGNAGILEQW